VRSLEVSVKSNITRQGRERGACGRHGILKMKARVQVRRDGSGRTERFFSGNDGVPYSTYYMIVSNLI
jgi:hypothetical protein